MKLNVHNWRLTLVGEKTQNIVPIIVIITVLDILFQKCNNSKF